MTEQEWNESQDSQAMLEWLRHSEKTSERKLRLFAVACCRRIWHRFTDARSRCIVELAEEYADGVVGQRELAAAADAEFATAEAGWPANAASCAAEPSADGPLGTDDYRPYLPAARNAAVFAAFAVAAGKLRSRQLLAEEAAQAALLRCIFGPLPFRAVSFDPAWRTEAVVGLAQRIYEQRAFELLPELGAALHDAGCNDAEILGHCTSAGPHVRGCWEVDLLLGRE